MEQLHPLALWLIALQLIKYWQIAPIKHWPIKVYTPPTFITFHVPINATSCCFPACQVNDDKHPNPSLLSLAHLYPQVFQFNEVWQFQYSNAAVMVFHVLQPKLSALKKHWNWGWSMEMTLWGKGRNKTIVVSQSATGRNYNNADGQGYVVWLTHMWWVCPQLHCQKKKFCP